MKLHQYEQFRMVQHKQHLFINNVVLLPHTFWRKLVKTGCFFNLFFNYFNSKVKLDDYDLFFPFFNKIKLKSSAGLSNFILYRTVFSQWLKFCWDLPWQMLCQFA